MKEAVFNFLRIISYLLHSLDLIILAIFLWIFRHCSTSSSNQCVARIVWPKLPHFLPSQFNSFCLTSLEAIRPPGTGEGDTNCSQRVAKHKYWYNIRDFSIFIVLISLHITCHLFSCYAILIIPHLFLILKYYQCYCSVFDGFVITSL